MELSTESIDEIFAGYSTPIHQSATTHCEDSDDIIAPPYSPISIPSILNTPQQDLSNSSLLHSFNSQSVLPHSNAIISDWKGFVVVGDNIDKTVHARHQTLESRNRSLHYFNSYAVLDRCNFSLLPEHHVIPDLKAYDVTKLLPSKRDLDTVLNAFAILVGRILTAYLPGFESYKTYSTTHIQHKYSTEMNTRSDVVSCNNGLVCTYIIILCIYTGPIRNNP